MVKAKEKIEEEVYSQQAYFDFTTDLHSMGQYIQDGLP